MIKYLNMQGLTMSVYKRVYVDIPDTAHKKLRADALKLNISMKAYLTKLIMSREKVR